MCKKHPDVKKFGTKIDISDVESDPVLQFQRRQDLKCENMKNSYFLQPRHYVPLSLTLNFILPVVIACAFGESFNAAWNGNIYRYLVGLHVVWCLNSVSHMWGYRPFDK